MGKDQLKIDQSIQKHIKHKIYAFKWILNRMTRDVANEHSAGAAPPGNLPASPRNFARYTFLGKFKLPTFYLLPRTAFQQLFMHQIIKFWILHIKTTMRAPYFPDWKGVYCSEHLLGILCISRNMFSGYIPDENKSLEKLNKISPHKICFSRSCDIAKSSVLRSLCEKMKTLWFYFQLLKAILKSTQHNTWLWDRPSCSGGWSWKQGFWRISEAGH